LGATLEDLPTMKTSSLICAFSLIASFALVSCSKADETNNPAANQSVTTSGVAVVAAPLSTSPGFADPAKLTAMAPETFKAVFDTTKGKFTIEVTRSLAPNGADRCYNLVRSGYFTDVAFFRVVPGFMCQFGIHGDPNVSAKWRGANISDDSVKGSNTRGTITFATAGPNTRTTQLFINFGNNVGLDGQGFSPFGKVTEGMDVVDKLYGEYGDAAAFGGHGPDQGRVQMEGNAYLKKDFPNLDYIKSATIVPADAAK
jgi:peptidyl-prolyl cis-trans isomerase A (cyclophilin A)